MTSRAAESVVVIRARDRALQTLGQFQSQMDNVAKGVTRLSIATGRASAAFAAMQLSIGLVLPSLVALIATSNAVSFNKFLDASRRARIQLAFMGLSLDQARDSVEALSGVLDRGAATSFFNSQKAIEAVGVLGVETSVQLAKLSEEFAKVAGLEPADVFAALAEATATGNVERFKELVLGSSDLALNLGKLEDLTAAELISLIETLTNEENISRVAELADNLERLQALELPGAATVREAVAGFINIFVESLATQLEGSEEDLKTAFEAGLIAPFILGAKGVGRQVGTGLIVGIITELALNLDENIERIVNDPETFAVSLAAMLAVGKIFGVKLVGGILSLLILELSPGISSALDTLSTNEKLQLVALGAGFIVGRSMRRGVVQSLAIGVIISEAFGDLTEDDVDLEEIIARIILLISGLILGIIVRNPIGGLIAGQLVGDFIIKISNSETAERINRALDDFFEHIEEVAVDWTAKIASAIIDGFNEVIDFFKDWGPKLADAVKDAIDDAIAFVKEKLKDLTPSFNIPGFNFSFSGKGFAEGGVVPGPVGMPQLAVVHGGETIIPANGVGGRPMVIQLVLDKRVIGEVALDAFGRETKFRSSITPNNFGP